MNAIETFQLKKNFGARPAVQGIDLRVPAGEIFSLLGPNGAGKSTTIAMLSGLLAPSGGDAVMFGYSIIRQSQQAKAVLGIVPQEIALYPDLSAIENLRFWGQMYGLGGKTLQTRVDEILDLIDLRDRQNDLVGKFSGGMQRRVNIGAALLHRPQLLIMDEPTVGIDPQSRRHILDSVKALNQQGMTVLYTTHYMEEAAELSDQIAIMDQGQIIANGSHSQLIHLIGGQTRVEIGLNGCVDGLLSAWRAMPGVSAVNAKDNQVSLLTENANTLLPLLFESTAGNGLHITAVEICEPNLEMVFLHLTGRALRD